MAFVGNYYTTEISCFLDDDSVVFCTQNVWFMIQIVHCSTTSSTVNKCFKPKYYHTMKMHNIEYKQDVAIFNEEEPHY